MLAAVKMVAASCPSEVRTHTVEGADFCISTCRYKEVG